MCLDVNLFLFTLLRLLAPVDCFPSLVLGNPQLLSFQVLPIRQSLSSPFETPIKLCWTPMYPPRVLPSILYCLLILVHTALSLQVLCNLLPFAGHFVWKSYYRNNLRPRISLASFITSCEMPEGTSRSEPWLYNPWITVCSLPLEWFPSNLPSRTGVTVPRSLPLVSS